MLYAFTQDVPIDAAFYGRITTGLGDSPPEGLVVHLVVERAEGGLRYLDVWESREHWDRFVEERLHPVVHGLLSEVFGDDLPPEPQQVPMSVVHAWTQSADVVGGGGVADLASAPVAGR